MNVRMLFNINPNKIRNVAKDKDFSEFCEYFEKAQNCGFWKVMTEEEKREFYNLAKN